ncbi:hypothetical protein [Coleofasciculus sp. FACHB-SPT9]|uniref:hypothetical protein n=1 Tax=Cyanophyceae TaxID=3028117 RepID=UPI0016839FDE|nr:hypothetical protein [Coleofasciculus sp. FACHB-SPT9]MBD1887963.1 hypothetical protein [Coleofasciculus sp. FACHB-SPT9]
MGRRFSRLDYATRVLKATGGAIDNYKAFKAGTADYDVEGQKRNGTVRIGVRPFGILVASPAAPTIYPSSLSGRADGQITANGLSKLTLSHRDADDVNASGAGFNSAKIIVQVAAGATTSKISQITKLSYDKTPTESYTIPFGAVDADAATEGVYEAFQRLAGQVAAVAPAAGTSRRVSFRPERFRQR